MNQFVSTLFLLLISSVSIFAQQNISGKVIDSKTNSPVGRAVIALVYSDENQAFQTAFTDFEGKYQISLNPKKDFYLKVQMMGYANFERKISICKRLIKIMHAFLVCLVDLKPSIVIP